MCCKDSVWLASCWTVLEEYCLVLLEGFYFEGIISNEVLQGPYHTEVCF